MKRYEVVGVGNLADAGGFPCTRTAGFRREFSTPLANIFAVRTGGSMVREIIRVFVRPGAMIMATAISIAFAWGLPDGVSIPTIDQIVPGFYSRNESVYSALLRFGRENHIPLGLIVNAELCSTNVEKIDARQASVGAVLGKLADKIPSYVWKLEDSVVVVIPKSTPDATSDFLGLKVAPINIGEGVLQVQGAFAWMSMKAPIRPNEGTAFDMLTSVTAQHWPSLNLTNNTVEQVLNHLVGRKTGGAWVLYSFDDLKEGTDHQPFLLYDYSDDPVSEPSCIAARKR